MHAKQWGYTPRRTELLHDHYTGLHDREDYAPGGFFRNPGGSSSAIRRRSHHLNRPARTPPGGTRPMTEQHTNPDHDYESPRRRQPAARAVVVQNMPHCKYCLERRTLVAMTGDGWGLNPRARGHLPVQRGHNHDAHEVLVEHMTSACTAPQKRSGLCPRSCRQRGMGDLIGRKVLAGGGRTSPTSLMCKTSNYSAIAQTLLLAGRTVMSNRSSAPNVLQKRPDRVMTAWLGCPDGQSGRLVESAQPSRKGTQPRGQGRWCGESV